ncbi:ion transporter [Bailinhaonella thermotolerans]|uniref:Ion transporter n=1 Tax=Bailinhaonella thermotolerans TaxID=1070861 RepID=A0A3A4BBS9_9ACTN|nr:ion transporter [Bailinhaonella thermotolerans]RJL31628.1 ion transporter [Bailinhaonella thermotolerans]
MSSEPLVPAPPRPAVLSRERVRAAVESRRAQRVITVVILVNAATLGIETSPAMLREYGGALHAVDHAALYVFVAELAAKVYAYRLRFFRDPWNVFDFLIVGMSLLPTTGGLSVLRALRIMRALRLISVVPSLRRVVSALLTAVPGMASIGVLLALVLYVAAVMATKLYGAAAPGYFSDLGTSLLTLFQVMTGDAWSDVAQEVMAKHPSAWVFFVVFILVCTFVVLNLFIAVVVRAMEDETAADSRAASEKNSADRDDRILAELASLQAEVRALKDTLNGGLGAEKVRRETAAVRDIRNG